MSFQLLQGLFSSDFTDLHAVLGLSVEASADETRKRYIQIARRLHPDSYATASETDKQIANEFLSKFVNPSYKKLTAKDKEIAEYQLLLKIKGQQAANSPQSLTLQSDLAQQLLQDPNWRQQYQQAVQELSERQYASLEQLLVVTQELSELNLAYLVRREGQPASRSTATSTSAGQTAARTTAGAATQDTQTGTKIGLSAFIEQYCRRAEELIAKNQFAAAIKELRDALKDDPTNSRCHALLGSVYLKQNQLTMARISFDQALKFDPKNGAALIGKQDVERRQKSQAGKAAGAAAKDDSAKPGGGLFGLFGGKKK
jgi:curved DNA-binding protein CbpA